MKVKITHIFFNKIILYLISRYFTFFIQFLSSLIVAVKFGPFYLGIWGYISMLINYISYVNLGIPYSLNILLVQDKNNVAEVKSHVANSVILTFGLSIIILFLGVSYFVFEIDYFEKYHISYYFYYICLIGIIYHFASIFGTIYRVKNRIFELAFFQSSVPLFVFVSLFFSSGKKLIDIMLIMTALGQLLSLLVFLFNKKIPFGGVVSLSGSIKILNKGIYLFIYNLCFFLIVLSTRTIVSAYFKVEEFGYFSFSFNLSNSILLFLQALSVVIFPKIIDKLNTNDSLKVINIILKINTNYVTLSYGMTFVALLFYPIFLVFLPKYENTILAFDLISLALLLFTNSFGYSSYLMAKNSEKILAIISCGSLILNITISLFLIYVIQLEYEYLILATMFSYLVFSYLCAHFSRKTLMQTTNFVSVFLDFFPLKLALPYLLAVILVLSNLANLLVIPFVLYLLFNKVEIVEIFFTVKKIIFKPTFADFDNPN